MWKQETKAYKHTDIMYIALHIGYMSIVSNIVCCYAPKTYHVGCGGKHTTSAQQEKQRELVISQHPTDSNCVANHRVSSARHQGANYSDEPVESCHLTVTHGSGEKQFLLLHLAFYINLQSCS